MPDVVIAARGASFADRGRADLVYDGKIDVAVLAEAFMILFLEAEIRKGAI